MYDYAVETAKLCKQYGSQIVVNQVDLHIRKGRIYGLLGRNGAGKTTIMKLLLGLVSVSSGEIQIFGERVRKNSSVLYSRIGSTIETPGFYSNLTGTENLQVFAKLRGTVRKNAVQEALRVVNLPYHDKKKFASYSLGMKQRLGIANAILNEPELLILDEPTNGLDPIGIAEIRAFLRNLSHEQEKTILISSHILSEIALLADDIGILHEGKLLEEDSLDALKQKNQTYILVQVSDVSAAAYLLEKEMKITNYSVESDNIIRIYDVQQKASFISRCLIEAGLELVGLQTCCDTLEDYFKKITGGVGIA